MTYEALAIGCAAGFGGDRTDAALPIVETLIARKGSGVLIFEMLAERTLALAQLDRRQNPQGGYAPLMERMVGPILRRCLENNIPIVSNFGAANPRAAARRVRQMAVDMGISNTRIAVVEGDDLSDPRGQALLRPYLTAGDAYRELVSANVYLGATAIADAMRAGAQVVVTGRVADPSLVVGPAMAHFGWSETDWDTLGRATMAGHLLECGAQVTGGYFADPGFKDVPGLHAIGYPIAELAEDGSFIITKAESTGGMVDCRTVKEQLLYELHDPAAYLTPDVVADISEAEVKEIGVNRVAVTWQGEHRFDAGRPGGPAVRIDASAQTGPSPVDALLIALGTCTSVDVVEILAKRRTPVATLTVNVEAARADASPKRVIGALLTFAITGEGIDRAQAERAIDLSVTKYCSVRDSLDPALPVQWKLVLNGSE